MILPLLFLPLYSVPSGYSNFTVGLSGDTLSTTLTDVGFVLLYRYTHLTFVVPKTVVSIVLGVGSSLSVIKVLFPFSTS